MQQGSPTLRITSRCSTREEAADYIRRLCDGNRVSIPSLSPQPAGIEQRFCITLADGLPVFAGVGLVLGSRAGDSNEFARVELEILSLERGEELLDVWDDKTIIDPDPPDWDDHPGIGAAGFDDIATVAVDRLAAGTRPSAARNPNPVNASRMPRVVVGTPPVAVVEHAPNPLVGLEDSMLEGLVDSTLGELPKPPGPPPSLEPQYPFAPAPFTPPRPALATPAPYKQPDVAEAPRRRIGQTEVGERRRRRRALLVGVIVAALAAGVVIGNLMPGWMGSQAGPSNDVRASSAPPAEAQGAAGTVAGTAPATDQVVADVDAGAATAVEADTAVVADDAAVGGEVASHTLQDGGAAADAPESHCELSVSGSPRRAKVFVGERSLGTTPLRAEVECGEVKLRIVGAGHKAKTQTVVARADQPTEISFRLERVMTRLRILSAPPGATVRMRGRRVGKTPLAVSVPAFATSTVSVELDGYKKWSRRVRVGASGETVKAMLWPL
jgi:hypothetical protein